MYICTLKIFEVTSFVSLVKSGQNRKWIVIPFLLLLHETIRKPGLQSFQLLWLKPYFRGTFLLSAGQATLPFNGASLFPTAWALPTWFGVEWHQELSGIWAVLVGTSLLSTRRFNVSSSSAAATGGYCQNAPHQLLCFPASSKLSLNHVSV